jgi:hypothetical protein
VSETWTLPGYDVEALIGFGATGEVWRAREVATGETVALKRLRDVTDPLALAALRREGTLLAALDTPYVVRLRAVVDDVLVLDHAAGGSLATLLVRRRALDPGEVVTVAAPLAAGLAAAHAAGLVHGDVSPANVLFTAAGMPMLSDLGVARLAGQQLATVDGTAEYVDPTVAAGGEPDAAADVWSLAALCHHLLAGTPPHDGVSAAAVLGAAVAGERAPLGLLAPRAPRPLVAAIEAALTADPRARPDAATFASLLRRAHAAAPVRFPPESSTAAAPPVEERPTHIVRVTPSEPAAPGRHRRRRPPRSVLPALGLLLLVVLAAVGGWSSGRADSPRPAATAPQVAVRPATAGTDHDWRAVLEALDAARAEAFRTGDPARLATVWRPDSAALEADTAALTRLVGEGHRATGLRHQIRSVEVVDADGEGAVLRVVDVLAEHQVRDGTGAVVRQIGPRPETTWRVELSRSPNGWWLSSVTPT